jgi:hypothetical protein
MSPQIAGGGPLSAVSPGLRLARYEAAYESRSASARSSSIPAVPTGTPSAAGMDGDTAPSFSLISLAMGIELKFEELTRDLLGHAIRSEWDDFANVAEDIGEQRLLVCPSSPSRMPESLRAAEHWPEARTPGDTSTARPATAETS